MGMQSRPEMVGSSPLARGLRPIWRPVRIPLRIIPARAGFTAYGDRKTTWGNGSSPLARGLLLKFVCYPYAARIIPARAGFTWDMGYRNVVW